MSVNEHRFADFSTLIEKMSQDVIEVLHLAIDLRGRATLVVSGGTTPAPLFDALSKADIDWSKVTLTLADDRWVDEEDLLSNARLVKTRLMVGRAAAASFVPLYVDGHSPESARTIAGARVRELYKPFDMVLLGMGRDAHTASLFPDAPELAAAMDPNADALCMSMNPPSVSGARMTMTMPTLMHSRRIAFLIRGWDKWPVYQKATESEDFMRMPVAAFLNQDRIPVDVYWAE